MEHYDSKYDGLNILDEFRTKDEAYDQWDDYYGRGYYSYEVYVLTDMTKPGKYQYGLITLEYEPFYVGHGRIGRMKKSWNIDWDNIHTFKQQRILEIGKKGGNIYGYKLGLFYTKNKASVVEKKVMNIIPRELLTNSVINYCPVPLTEKDLNIHLKHLNQTKENKEILHQCMEVIKREKRKLLLI